HPKDIIGRGNSKVKYLTPLTKKKHIFSSLNVDILYIVKFDLILSKLLPEEFIKKVVIPLNPKHVVAGFDFTYGYKALGNMNTIKDDGSSKFQVTTVHEVKHENKKISTTFIKKLLDNGEVGLANKFLKDYYK